MDSDEDWDPTMLKGSRDIFVVGFEDLRFQIHLYQSQMVLCLGRGCNIRNLDGIGC